jgi:ElaB/YqjD/DUF883 family membrane-anchored ribosome-binding protein
MSRDPMKPFDDRQLNQEIDDVRDRVSDLTSKVKDKAGQMADTVSEKLGQQRESAAETLGRAASTIHEKAGSVPGGPKVVNFTHSIADGMESTASYLRGRDFSEMGKDVMNVCRRYPTQSLVAALAVGFLIGRSRR